jgi:uncharacterized protein (TIGR01244 family)
MFRNITPDFMVSPQIDTAGVAEAAALGVTLIINNRPEGETDDQIPGTDIAAAAGTAGVDYVAIPITHAGFSQPQIEAMNTALGNASGKVLAYCRSGTRSALLWSLVQSKNGNDYEATADTVAQAGYDISSIKPLMDMLRAQP